MPIQFKAILAAWIGVATFAAGVATSADSEPRLSIDEIVEQFKIRDELLNDYAVEYRATRVQFGEWKSFSKENNQALVKAGRLPQRAVDDLTGAEDDIFVTRVRAIKKDGASLYKIWDSKDNPAAFTSKVYRDGVLTSHDESRKIGSRKAATERSVDWLPTVEKMITYGDKGIADYLKHPPDGVTNKIFDEPKISDSGDILWCVTSKHAKGDVGVLTGYGLLTIWVNSSRNFWPELIQEQELFVNKETGEEALFERKRTEIKSYVKAGNISFPKSISWVKTHFDWPKDFKYDALPMPARTLKVSMETIDLDEFVYRPDVPATDLEGEFPSGTRFRDLDNETYIVNPEGAAKSLSEMLKTPLLQQGEHSPKEAFAKLAERKSAPQDGGVSRRWIWIINALVLAAIVTIIIVRRR